MYSHISHASNIPESFLSQVCLKVTWMTECAFRRNVHVSFYRILIFIPDRSSRNVVKWVQYWSCCALVHISHFGVNQSLTILVLKSTFSRNTKKKYGALIIQLTWSIEPIHFSSQSPTELNLYCWTQCMVPEYQNRRMLTFCFVFYYLEP